jgi:hypothetical protein
MTAIVEEGRIVGYQYSILEVKEGEYFWWAERPGGTACWRGNVFPVPTSIEEAKQQISETLEKYGVSVPPSP